MTHRFETHMAQNAAFARLIGNGIVFASYVSCGKSAAGSQQLGFRFFDLNSLRSRLISAARISVQTKGPLRWAITAVTQRNAEEARITFRRRGLVCGPVQRHKDGYAFIADAQPAGPPAPKGETTAAIA